MKLSREFKALAKICATKCEFLANLMNTFWLEREWYLKLNEFWSCSTLEYLLYAILCAAGAAAIAGKLT